MRYSPLEIAVMQALTWDLRDVAPDLAGQFEESLPGSRRNTGFGMFTEMIASPRRPAPHDTPTGSFGTVHAMVGDLPGSMAFKVVLRDGVLLGMEGEAFDMETDDIDFATTSFHTVFTVNDQGTSIAFKPEVLLGRSPLLDLQTWDDQTAGSEYGEPSLVNVGAVQRVQDAARRPMAAVSETQKTTLPKLDEAQTTLFIGLCVAIIVLALLIWWLSHLPLAVVAIGAFWVCRMLWNPRALTRISQLFARLQTEFDANQKR